MSSPNFVSRQGLIRRSGQKAFKLSANQQQDSWILFNHWLYCSPHSKIFWHEYYQGQSEQLNRILEYSIDGEVTWNSLKQDKGRNTPSFSEETVSLGDLAGQIIKIRIRLHSTKTYSNNESDFLFLDDFSFVDVYHLSDPVVNSVSGKEFSLTTKNSGNSLLTVELADSTAPFAFSTPTLSKQDRLSAILSFLEERKAIRTTGEYLHGLEPFTYPTKVTGYSLLHGGGSFSVNLLSEAGGSTTKHSVGYGLQQISTPGSISTSRLNGYSITASQPVVKLFTN